MEGPVFQPVPGARDSARKIGDEEWERLRPIIIQAYSTKTLMEVKEYMAGIHNFHATSRQFVHRLLRWGVTKYKKNIGGSAQSQQAQAQSQGSIEPEPTRQLTLQPMDHTSGTSYHQQAFYHQVPDGPRFAPSSAMVAMEPLPARPGPGKRSAVPLQSLDNPADSPTAKRPREEPEPEAPGNFSCPFRKRNPTRFNIHNYQTCATHVFTDILQLKRHIKNFHRPNPSRVECPRCRKMFDTADELRAHMLLPVDQICKPELSVPPRDPEDGITAEVEEALNERKSSDKIKSWDELWHLVFPQDDDVPPSDFESPIEHFELQKFLQDRLPGLMTVKLEDELHISLPNEEIEDKIREILESVFDSFQQSRTQPRRQT